MSGSPPDLVIVGRVRKAHGIRGDLVVEPITDEPAAVFASGRRVFAGTVTGDPAKDGGELHVERASAFKGGFIVHFAEINDRSVAETWRDRYLLLPSSELEPLADGQIYLHELHGMDVVLKSGDVLGTVEELYELPQGLALGVNRGGGAGSVLIPYDRVVVSVERDIRRITIDPPEGLLD
jgi:16S rRNA processing protein RimM